MEYVLVGELLISVLSEIVLIIWKFYRVWVIYMYV